MDKSKLVVVLTVVLGAAARAEAQVAEVSLGAGGAQLTAGYETWSINVHSPALEGRAKVRLTDRFSEPMLFPSVGFGMRKSLGNHLAVRADADVVAFLVMPAGVRASVGLTLPLGPAQ